jgi:hypothetical protein
MHQYSPALQERYENGWYQPGGMTHYPGPDWALALNWDDVACWLTVKLSDLQQVLPSTRIHSHSKADATMVLQSLQDTHGDGRRFFDLLETRGINIFALLPDLVLECWGATWARDIEGVTALVGQFELSGQPSLDGPVLKMHIPGRLIVTLPPGGVDTLSPGGFVAHFRVHASIKLCSGDVFPSFYPDLALDEGEGTPSLVREGARDAVFLNRTRPRRSQAMVPGAVAVVEPGRAAVITGAAGRLSGSLRKIAAKAVDLAGTPATKASKKP